MRYINPRFTYLLTYNTMITITIIIIIIIFIFLQAFADRRGYLISYHG